MMVRRGYEDRIDLTMPFVEHSPVILVSSRLWPILGGRFHTGSIHVTKTWTVVPQRGDRIQVIDGLTVGAYKGDVELFIRRVRCGGRSARPNPGAQSSGQ